MPFEHSAKVLSFRFSKYKCSVLCLRKKRHMLGKLHSGAILLPVSSLLKIQQYRLSKVSLNGHIYVKKVCIDQCMKIL
jgi:hypothetical protein